MTLPSESLIGMPYRPLFQPLSHEAEQVARRVPSYKTTINNKVLTAIHPIDKSGAFLQKTGKVKAQGYNLCELV